MRSAVLRAARAARWYVRQASGEAKWDEYVERCRVQGIGPMVRRDFERHRADHRERRPQSRCC